MLFVTGATGLLGNNLFRAALARGLAATALVRAASPRRPLEGLGARVATVDLANDELEALFAPGDVVIHAAARVAIGRRDLAGFRRDNVIPTVRIAAACRARGARLVHVSTVDTLAWGPREAPGDETPAAVDPAPTAYSRSKREAEEAVRAEEARGLDAVTVHPALMLGPWDWKPSSGRLLIAVARSPLALAPPGGNDVCHAGDVAEAILTAAEKAPAGSRYVLGGEALTYAEAFRLMRRIAGRSERVMTLPAALLRAAGLAGDLVGSLTGSEPGLNSASAAVAARPHHCTYARAARELGYRPRPAEAAIADAWAWFVQYGYAS